MNMQVMSILCLIERLVNELYVAFDPIFFLHHCNVDRIYAFWEYVYPEYWIDNGWKNSQTGQIVPFGECVSRSISLEFIIHPPQ